MFSCSVMFSFLWPCGLQHTRSPYPSLLSGVCSNSCPLSQWRHLTILASVIPFSFCLESFLAQWSFPSSQFFTLGGQDSSVLLVNIQSWFPLGLTGLISLQSKDSQESSSASQFEGIILWRSDFFMVHLSHRYITTGKIIALTRWTFVGKVISLLFNILSRFVIAFLPWSKCLLISWWQSLFIVILEPKKIKSATVSIFSTSIRH